MSDKETPKTVTEQTEELLTLKKQAKDLNIKFHPNIGMKALQKRIKEKQVEIAAEQQVPEPVAKPTQAKVMNSHESRQMKPHEVKEMLKREALELVRVRITCMNPNKKAWEGEIFSIANSNIPTQKKYVPFNIQEGWHIPKIMVDMIQSREYQAFVNDRDYRGRTIRKSVMKKEFNVEILPPLTNEELKELKAKQALAAGKVD